MTAPARARIPTSNARTSFPPHGTAYVSITGQIVRLYVEGPWNEEFVVEVHDALRREISQRIAGPWAMLVDYKGLALCGPQALKAIRESVAVEAKMGRIATAWVIERGVEGGQEMISFAQPTYAGINPIRVYRSEAEAEPWLTAMLALAREATSVNGQTTLFARVGGSAGVKGLVEMFYARILSDAALAPFFRNVAMDKLLRMQHELFSAALDGPVEYRGRPLAQVHQHLRIGQGDYRKFIRHLFGTLEELHLTDQERDEIVARLRRLSDDVVAGVGRVD
jgi:hemoglobin